MTIKPKKPRVDVMPIGKAATARPIHVNRHTKRGEKIVGNSHQTARGISDQSPSVGKGVDKPV